MSGLVVSVVALLVLGAPGLPAQQRLSQDEVLELVVRYAERFGRELQGIVARERYQQTIRSTRGRPSLDADTVTGEVLEQRWLLSSLLLVHEAETPWQLHRDVVAVDDQPVADREDRLARLFARPGGDRARELAVIADESARYNLGRFVRNINIPTFPLIVVHPSRRDRFRFRDRGTGRAGEQAVRVIAFEERGRPRIIRGTAGYDVALRGTLAVDEASGELVRAAVEPKAHRLEPRLVVHFARVAGVPLRVPVHLLESYWRPGDDSYVAGEARYDDFRRYGTDVSAPVVR